MTRSVLNRREGSVRAVVPDWIEGSFRFDSYETAVFELLALGPEVEVLLPTEMRETMAELGRRIAGLHTADQPGEVSSSTS